MNQSILLIIIVMFTVISCSQDSQFGEAQNTIIIEEDYRIIPNYQMSIGDIVNLQKLGFSGSSGIAVEKTNYFDERYVIYLMEGDIEIRKDSLKSMVSNIGAAKQYRTNNLVASPRTIRVIGMNMNNHPTLIQALILAIENYNNLNINLNFTLEFRRVKTINEAVNADIDSDILVKVGGTAAGGSAGFPTNGNPYSSVRISYTTVNFGLDVCEHVLTHEIGHCIGLRHTDFFNRSVSCGLGGNEGDANVGAIHIPGTPEMMNIDMNSIMLSCFNAFQSGEFSNFDTIALETLY